MAITSKYIFAASMDVAPDKEALFNEVYDICLLYTSPSPRDRG